MNFNQHYKKYLGINSECNERMLSCKQRDEMFCFYFKQILIISKFNNTNYYSIAPQFYDFLKNQLEPKSFSAEFDELLFEIDDVFCEILDRYQISKYLRLSNPNKPSKETPFSQDVCILDETNKHLYFKLLGERGKKFKEKQWIKRQKLILEKRYFLIIENNAIAAYSFLSDINNGGANIVVVTLPKYRKKGYGKALVSKAIEWCMNNDKIPIYLVNQNNTASINLANSLGFKTMSEEIIIEV